MNEIVKRDIIDILGRAFAILNERQAYMLRELSDHVIHNAAIFQDEDSISIAIVIYALSKILKSSDDVPQGIITHIRKAKETLAGNNEKAYRREIRSVLSEISKQDDKMKYYVKEVLEIAQIKKASKIYEHGISLAQVANTLGISRWELMDYIGKTTISDTFSDAGNIEQKMKFARSLFR